MTTRTKHSRKPSSAKLVKQSAAATGVNTSPKTDSTQEMRQFAKLAPGRLRVELAENELTIRRSLHNPQGYRQLLVNLAGLLLLALFGVRIWFSASALSDPAAKYLGLITAAVAMLPVLYYSLIVIFDEEVIRVNATGVQLFYRPLPYPGKRISSQEIAQLYTVTYEREQLASLQLKRKQYETVYGVRLKTERGKELPLVGGIAKQEEAKYVELMIEKSLGIQDRPLSSDSSDV